MAFAKWLAAATTATMTVTIAGIAMALSCAQGSIEDAFNTWNDSPDRYYLVSGTLTPAAPLPPIPAPGMSNGGSIDESTLRGVYRVQGEVLYGSQSAPLDHLIWVQVGCAGPWCGSFPTAGTSGVMALKQLPDQTLELYSGACPGDIFPDGDGAMKARVQQCISGGCESPLR